MGIIIGMLVCLIFSAFFSASETAYTSFSRSKMKTKAAEGNKGAERALKIAENYDKLLSTILVGNNIVNITLSTLATLWFVNIMTGAASAPAISTLVTTVIVLIFGEITPKSLAKDYPEAAAIAFGPLLRLISIILTPINLIFMLWKKLMKLIFKAKNDDTVTEGEVLTLVDEAHEDGTIDEYNKGIIENIFEFDDLSAGEIATHRTDLTILSTEDTDEEWEEAIYNSKFSRYPVCGERVDDIIGVLDARKYLRLEDKSRESVMANAVSPAYFVPENVKADVLFKNMRTNKEFFAVVLDEYGGFCGIVTLTNLVECIVGDITEDSEEEEAEVFIELLEDGRWSFSGLAPMEDVTEALGIVIPDCESDTFGGYALGIYGSIPEDGASFSVSTELLDIEVSSIKDHKVERAIVTLKDPETEEEKSEKREKDKEDDNTDEE